MFISYENDEVRECCLLLGPASLNSNFSSDEIKEIRAIIADLRAAPKLIDSPIKYNREKGSSNLNIRYGILKIVCKIISTFANPTDDKIERIKIVKIVNIGLQRESFKKHNFK